MVDKRMCNEVVVLFSTEEATYKDRTIQILLPKRIVRGYFDEIEYLFIDEQEVAYSHVLFNEFGVSFGKRITLAELLTKYPKSSLSEAKKKYLAEIRNKIYFYDENAETYSAESIKEMSKDGEKICRFKDIDIETYAAQFCSLSENNSLNETPEQQTGNISFETLMTSKTPIIKPEVESSQLNIKEIYEELSQRVIGQEEAHKKILRTIWKNHKRLIREQENAIADNIFVKGSTGVGKTETFRIIAKYLGVPIIIKDCNDYTINGYKGDDVDDIITDLVRAANGDVEKASHGIVVLDEVDKLGGKEGDYEISTSGVQMALLKMLEDKEYNIKGKILNTKGITFVAMGAFTNMEEKVIVPKIIGFERTNNSNNITNNNDITDLSSLERYGMKPEFLGRFANYVCMNELELEHYIKIILSKYSAFHKELEFLQENGVIINYDENSFIKALAEAAKKLNKGARGIEIVLANLFAEIESEIMLNDLTNVNIELSSETVSNPKKYVLKKQNN